MSLLKWTGWAGVCGLGTVSFLRAVACEKERVDRALVRRVEALDSALRGGAAVEAVAEQAAMPSATAAHAANGRERKFVSRK